MKIAIFSDIHGNLPAFEAMLKDAGTVDQYISLGDVVNYGPWNNECVQLLMSLDNCIRLRGNHDDYFISEKCGDSNIIARTSFNFCIKGFSEAQSLKTFQDEYAVGKYLLKHTINDDYIYPDSEITFSENYIIGHSHHQFVLRSDSFVLYNAGSVGQNRKFINIINYLLYDSSEDKFKMKAIVYNVDKVINEMKIRKYPDICINYYSNKNRWIT